MIVSTTLKDILINIDTEIGSIYPKEEVKAISSLLIQHITGFSKLELHTRKDEVIETNEVKQVEKAIGLLKQHIPVQYVIGETEFYDIPIKVSPVVLIPRPETEELVYLALKSNLPVNSKVLDIGTGSGCIAIALAKNLPNSEVFAMDVSFEALEIARKNAEDIGVNIHFFQRDILKQSMGGTGQYDLIISNPPYVTISEKRKMGKNVINNEPHLALFVPDSDPLRFYKSIALFAREHLNKDGWVMAEINEQYGEETAEIFREQGFINIEIIKDINGKDRIIKIQYT